MANKSLTDLTERTATADSDLIHVNSGGTDYKETKANFLSNITSSISSINSSLTQSSNTVAHNGQSGYIYLKRMANIRILNFDDVKVGSSSLVFTSNLPSADRPVTNANGCLYISSSKVALVWIDANGVLHTSGASNGEIVNGSVSWTV